MRALEPSPGTTIVVPAAIAPGESAVSSIETTGLSVQPLFARVPLNVAGAELWPGSSVPNDVGEPLIVMPGDDVVSVPATSAAGRAPVLDAAALTREVLLRLDHAVAVLVADARQRRRERGLAGRRADVGDDEREVLVTRPAAGHAVARDVRGAHAHGQRVELAGRHDDALDVVARIRGAARRRDAVDDVVAAVEGAGAADLEVEVVDVGRAGRAVPARRSRRASRGPAARRRSRRTCA